MNACSTVSGGTAAAVVEVGYYFGPVSSATTKVRPEFLSVPETCVLLSVVFTSSEGCSRSVGFANVLFYCSGHDGPKI